MTFSEYIKRNSERAYLTYCKQNYLNPIFDIKIEPPAKVCWLTQPKENENKQTL